MQDDVDMEVATHLLGKQPVTLTDAARLILEGIEGLGERLRPGHAVQILRQCIQIGVKQFSMDHQSIIFSEAVKQALQTRKGCSLRTIQDFRQCMNRLMREDATLAGKNLDKISVVQCEKALQAAYASAPSRRRKARSCLMALFNMGLKQGWCRENPVQKTELPKVKERPIQPLNRQEIERLLTVACRPEHVCCLPALGLMLLAGVRPQEVTRLSWGDLDMDEREVVVPARHSKTGGGRHIPMCANLYILLAQRQPKCATVRICPPNWVNRWRQLRQQAGFSTWQQDVLRHTYASYHAKAYHDLPALQLAMGHRDVSLLQTRYVNMRGISSEDALWLWGSRKDDARCLCRCEVRGAATSLLSGY